MRFLLDTNVVSDLVKEPQGRAAQRIARVGEQNICTSIIVAAELRYGITKRGSARLAARVEAVLAALNIEAFKNPADAIYGRIRARLEEKGRVIGGNDLLIAAHAIALGCTLVTSNKREFARVEGLAVENWSTRSAASSPCQSSLCEALTRRRARVKAPSPGRGGRISGFCRSTSSGAGRR